jgi:hypothetical protein
LSARQLKSSKQFSCNLDLTRILVTRQSYTIERSVTNVKCHNIIILKYN